MDKRQALASCHEHRWHIVGAILVLERWLKLLELAFDASLGIMKALWNRIKKPKEAPK